MKRKVYLEQFFTKPEVAEYCLSFIDLKRFDRIIEPSAGNGSFSNLIENCEAYDILPQNEKIIKQDFFTLNVEKGNILVVGNPPFGRQSSLAVKFINHAAEFSKCIAFILPLSFQKESMFERLDEHVFLNKFILLKPNSFYFEEEEFDIPCGFFIFDVLEKTREKCKKYETDDFIFCKKNEADFSIRRVGFYAGKVEQVDVSESSHYFIKDLNGAKTILEQIKYDDAIKTVGPRSISKNEIIKEYLFWKDKNMGLFSRKNL